MPLFSFAELSTSSSNLVFQHPRCLVWWANWRSMKIIWSQDPLNNYSSKIPQEKEKKKKTVKLQNKASFTFLQMKFCYLLWMILSSAFNCKNASRNGIILPLLKLLRVFLKNNATLWLRTKRIIFKKCVTKRNEPFSKPFYPWLLIYRDPRQKFRKSRLNFIRETLSS